MTSTAIIDPIAFQIGSYPVYWYGVILGTATLVAAIFTYFECRRINYDFNLFLDLLIYAIPMAIIGARGYYVIFNWDYYSANPGEIIKTWHGGLAIHGVLLGSIITAIIFAKIKKVSFMQLADIAGPSILLGQIIGRWGNFINQEAHGGPVSLDYLQSINLPQFIINQMYIDGTYYHPTFLYESSWNIVGIIFLIWLRLRNPIRGVIFASYLTWYSIGRFFIEGLRTDSLAFDGPNWLASFMELLWLPMKIFFEPGAMAYGNVRTAQLMSVLLVIGLFIYIYYIKAIKNSTVRYED
ncbi:MAG: prolipoprotein diacylglyceryl transferase [Vulcanibacillus sp.]